MSGHSKWSQIKRKKAKTDAQRGKAFSKVAKEITIAAKLGGVDEAGNARLRLAIQKAKEANMPAEIVKRAIQKGGGSSAAENLEEICFEAYAPHGVGLLIEVLTDNKNRTVPNIKNVLLKAGGSMATKGAVSYNFSQKGLFIFEPGISEDVVVDIAINADADSIDLADDESIEVLTRPDCFEHVKRAFDDQPLAYVSATVTMIPKTTVSLDQEQSEKLLTLIEKLEDDDDVQDVHHNAILVGE